MSQVSGSSLTPAAGLAATQTGAPSAAGVTAAPAVTTFQLTSDLHLEHHDSYPGLAALLAPRAAPYLIAAGDIGDPTSSSYAQFLEDASAAYEGVFLVAGNHEFYNQPGCRFRDMAATREALSAAASLHPNVHLLEHSTVDVGPSVRVIGATMWSFVPPNVIPAVWAGLNDYEMIYHGGRRLSPDDTNSMLTQAVAWIQQELSRARADGKKALVVTHHMPSFSCTHPRFKGSILNHAFATDLDYLLAGGDVHTWAFGHTHEACDTRVGPARVVCNPFGYPREPRSTKYNRACVLEV